MNNLKHIDNWCLKNSIPYKDSEKIHLYGSSKAILVGSDKNEATEKNVSGAVLVGSGKDNALKKDSLVEMPKGELSDQQYQDLLKTFKDSPASGCVTVLDMARNSSGYYPLSDSTKNFEDYIKRVLEAPFFNVVLTDSSKYNRKESDWDKAINSISELYDDVKGEEQEEIKKSIKLLARTAASKVDEKQTKNLFVQSTLKIDKIIQVYIYSSHIVMEESDNKGANSKQTDITIKKVKLDFYVDLWSSYAEVVMKRHVMKVVDWLDNNTSKKTSKKVNLTCLK